MNVVKNRKIGFLGAGNMAQAMMERWVSEKTLPLENIYVSNRSRRKLEKIKDTWGLKIVKHNEELLDECDIVIVGVKPQDLTEALDPLGSVMRDDHIFISMAAGVPLQKLKSYFIKGSVVRVMPNAPLKNRSWAHRGGSGVQHSHAPGLNGGPFQPHGAGALCR